MSDARGDRLAATLGERELDGLLVTSPVNVRYLTGFTGTNGACLVQPERRLFFTDFRYVEQADEQVTGFEPVRGKQDLLADIAAEFSAGRLGFEDSHLTVRGHERLREALPDEVELVSAGTPVERLREVKEPAELERIRAAAGLADEVFELVTGRGLAGRTELEVARDFERELSERRAEPSFPPIVASGGHGALPHAEPRDVEIAKDVLVTIDYGAKLDGYCSDCTRTLATGDVGGEARELYELVRRAQADSVEAVRADIGCKELDAVARDLIAEAGHGDDFGHGLGHGVGMEVHEGPRLSHAVPEEEKLAAGMVVTIEPGVYLAGKRGVRIEDLVVVTDEGCEILSAPTKNLIEA